MKKIVLIGPGRLGQAVAKLLHESGGYDLRAIISRNEARARAAARFADCRHAATTDLSRAREGELVFIALPDDHIGALGATLRREGYLAPGATLIHFSGLHPASILLGEEGPLVDALAIHPLQTFADPVVAVRTLAGSPFSVEGTEAKLPLAEKLVEDLGGIPFRITADKKPLYHAAACMASNYVVSLTTAACQIMAACGFSEPEALQLLIPLIQGTARNLSLIGPEHALTGPISRGDRRTIVKHLRAMAELPSDLQEIYRVMGKKTIEVAWRKGTLTTEAGKKILQLLEQGLGNED
jgi:predicted short-subunit dehydrogenase-like oxidoreductase (DUF2520 family)